MPSVIDNLKFAWALREWVRINAPQINNTNMFTWTLIQWLQDNAPKDDPPVCERIDPPRRAAGKPKVRKLGKLSPVNKPGLLKLAKYTNALPPPPASVDYGTKVPVWGDMRNSDIGDCTCAALGHAIQIWTYNDTKSEVTVSDDAIVAFYSDITGYTPDKPESDTGAAEINVLEHWKVNPLDNHKLLGYARVDIKNKDEVKSAINIFGGLYIGIAMPESCADQKIWDVVKTDPFHPFKTRPGSWGGHAVYVAGYDHRYVTVVTWGALQKLTWAFWDKYVDEAYALVSPDWVGEDGVSLHGTSLDQLLEDLKRI